MNSILKIIDENLHVIDQSIQSRQKIETEKNQKMVREFDPINTFCITRWCHVILESLW